MTLKDEGGETELLCRSVSGVSGATTGSLLLLLLRHQEPWVPPLLLPDSSTKKQKNELKNHVQVKC